MNIPTTRQKRNKLIAAEEKGKWGRGEGWDQMPYIDFPVSSIETCNECLTCNEYLICAFR